jgi:cleavage stimulation factor subunit 3
VEADIVVQCPVFGDFQACVPDMTDVDEIPVSEAEQAFFDAMRALDDVRDTQAATDTVEQPADEPAAEKAVETIIESNGNPRDGSDGEVSAAKDGAVEQAQEGREDSSAATSARNSVAPSVSSIVSVGDVAANGSAEVSTNTPPLIAIPKDESTENSTPTPTTPATTQSPPKSVPVSQSAPTQKSTTGGKRKRLPQDLVGQLEDRIAGDPKGDVDAWLSLVEEHKRKGKFDDARKVYDRFFQIFPQTVSYGYNPNMNVTTNKYRPNNG